MAIWIRNTIYAACLLLVSPWIVFRGLRTGRYQQGISEKFFGLSTNALPSQDAAPALESQNIWLHGVSVGEVLLLRPLVKQLLAKYPQARIFVSTTTQSGSQLAHQIMPPEVHVFYFPLDFSWAIRRTLKTLKPRLLVLGELELWPNLVALCQLDHIPVVVVNGRLSQNSFRGYQRLLPLVKNTFAKLSSVCAQTTQYGQRFVDCGVDPARVKVTGSLKFDNVQFDRNAASVVGLRDLVGIKPEHTVVIAGSTQIEEEQAALDAFLALHEHTPNLRLIIVPRHPERFEQVARAIDLSGLSWLRRSALREEGSAAQWQVLLVDTIGELSSWWGVASIALVGGTFGARGGQNMIEPSAYGCNVAFGPKTSNFRDVVELLLANDAASRLESPDDFLPWLQRQLDDPEAGQVRGRNAAELVRQQQGAMQATLDVLGPFLSPLATTLRTPAA